MVCCWGVAGFIGTHIPWREFRIGLHQTGEWSLSGRCFITRVSLLVYSFSFHLKKTLEATRVPLPQNPKPSLSQSFAYVQFHPIAFLKSRIKFKKKKNCWRNFDFLSDWCTGRGNWPEVEGDRPVGSHVTISRLWRMWWRGRFDCYLLNSSRSPGAFIVRVSVWLGLVAMGVRCTGTGKREMWIWLWIWILICMTNRFWVTYFLWLCKKVSREKVVSLETQTRTSQARITVL